MQIAQHSVQSLRIELSFRNVMLATATGFAIAYERGYALITNRHNVTGRFQHDNTPMALHGGLPDRISIWHNASQPGTWIKKTYPLYDSAERPLWHEHPTLGSNADIVALSFDVSADMAVYPYSIERPLSGDRTQPGDPVNVIGFPFGISVGGSTAIWSTGFVATDLDLDYNDQPVFLIDCRARPGQSGSPVVSRENKEIFFIDKSGQPTVLGIYSGRISPDSDLGMVWKRAAIAQTVNAIP